MERAVTVVLANSEQTERMGAAIPRAFQKEPNFTYIIPDEAKRQDALPWFFDFTARLGARYGRVYTTPDAAGGAVWIAPGAKMRLVGALHAGLLSLPGRFGWGGLMRSLEISVLVERMRKRIAPARHWYLLALGVDPATQGRGIGSALITPVLAEADSEGLTCYLDTFSERNVAFYRKSGFAVAGSFAQKCGFRNYVASYVQMLMSP